MEKQIINIDRSDEKEIIERLRKENSIDANRILRFYDCADLTRTEGNPINMIAQRVKAIDMFKDFDEIITPEIVGVYETFDLFNFASDHPARSKSDTYYADEDKILRTHTTVMWYYYLKYPGIKEKLEKDGEIGTLSHGKVYRKDEIDNRHYPVFHQIDGLYICEKSKKIIGKDELVDVLIKMAKSIYGEDIEYRVGDDKFPYTDPSVEMEVKFGDKRLEILGSGVVLPTVLDNLGIDSSRYNGWAFGPGIERLAMIKKGVPDIRIFWSQDARITNQWGNLETSYKDVSKYPSTYRDISFIIPESVSPNSYYEIVRDEGNDLVEEVELLDKYQNSGKFGEGNVSYTFRIVYRSHERTLTNDEINNIQSKIRANTEKLLDAKLR